MERLIEGYKRFKQNYWEKHREVFDALATKGQSPRAMLIACSDSRVDPQLIFDTEPGEVFVVRNVANLVPPYEPNSDYHGTSAALEFAVRSLKVSFIIVMGHSSCGGVRALLHDGEAGQQQTDFIGPWMSMAAAAREHALAHSHGDADAAQRMCEHETVKVSLRNLKSYPWIRERVEAGNLKLLGWYFDIETGDLTSVD